MKVLVLVPIATVGVRGWLITGMAVIDIVKFMSRMIQVAVL